MALSYNFYFRTRPRTTILRSFLLILSISFFYHTTFTWLNYNRYINAIETDFPCSGGRSLSRNHNSPSLYDKRYDASCLGKNGQTESHNTNNPLTSQINPKVPFNINENSWGVMGTDKRPEIPSSDDFQSSLGRLLSLLPDELHMSALIEPIKDTGEAKIRETGLRSRSFKELFEAWEKLHLVSHHDVSYIRNDIIQYLRAHPDVAKGLRTNVAEIIHSYEAYRHFLAYFSETLFPWITPYFSDPMSMRAQYLNQSRGLVFSAGNRQAPYLLTSIQSLRRIGCTLPIEVMYLGDNDLSEDFREELEVLPDVVTRDLGRMVNDDGWTLAGWAGKPFSILYSSFREVIFIDADSLFFRNPEELFEYPSYQKTGALFFKDRLMFPQSKKDWLQQILPKPISQKVRETRMWTGESAHMQESGVVVVDKWKHFVALLMVARMNGPDRDGKKDQGLVGVYDMVYGDKETFWLGWELVGDLDYTFHAGDAAVMGSAQPEPQTVQPEASDPSASIVSAKGNVSTSPPKPSKHTICAPQLLHLDSNGRPLWFNGWLLPNKFSGDKYQKPGNFTSYIREPRDSRSSGSWELKQNNVCCMTSTSVLDLSRDEVDVLGMTVDIAKRVGAIN